MEYLFRLLKLLFYLFQLSILYKIWNIHVYKSVVCIL